MTYCLAQLHGRCSCSRCRLGRRHVRLGCLSVLGLSALCWGLILWVAV